MRRTTHMKSEPTGKSTQATMGQRALCMLLSATLAFSSMPSTALRAIAEEQDDTVAVTDAGLNEDTGLEQGSSEVEPGEGTSTDLDDPTTETTGEDVDPSVEPEPTAEPEPQQEPELDDEPTVDSDVQPAEPTTESEDVTETSTERQSEAQPVEGTTVTVGIEASQGIVPATDSVTLTAVGPDGTTLEDGSYLTPNVLLKVMGSNISGSELPTVTLTYKDTRGKTHTKSYVLSNDDAENQQWVDGGGVYVATVHVDTPGTYVSASISGGSCFYDGAYVELKGSTDFSPQFRVAGVELAEIIMLDKNGDEIVDDSDQVINLLDATSKTVIDPEIIQVRLTGKVDVTRSLVELIDYAGTIVEPCALEEDPENPGTYIAKIKGYVDSATVKELQDGYYAIKVFAEDEYGNQLTDDEGNSYALLFGKNEEQTDGTKLTIPDGNLLVDRKSPDLVLNYPHDKASDIYTPETSDEISARVAAVPEGIDFFNTTTVVEVKIADFNLDDANTTIFGVPLSQIMASPSTAIEGIPCEVITSTASNGEPEIRISAYCGDGVYDVTEFVSAVDTVKGHEASTFEEFGFDGKPLDITHFIVDLSSPQVTQASIGFPPPDLGTDANGDPIVNGADNNDNVVWFVYAERGFDPTSIAITVNEPHGIRSIELLDASKTYVSHIGGFESELLAGNEGLTDAAHEGTYNLTLIDHLIDGLDYPDDVCFVITDFAGNQYFWSMNQTGQQGTVENPITNPTTNTDLWYDLNGDTFYMHHPTLLVPDETAPIVSVTAPADRTDTADPLYVRVFDGNQTLSLVVTELNLKYLRGFVGGDPFYDPHGFITGTYSGLNPDCPVITYTFTPGFDGATPVVRTVTVSDLLPVEGKPNQFTWSTTFGEDGDYEFDPIEIYDVARNKSNTENVEKFTIDATAPVIDVTYDNDSASTGVFYDASRTATITVTEHSFDSDLFEVFVSAKGGKQGMATPTASPWTNSGDKHTCTVSFNEDGIYALGVYGEDMAGNAASPYDSGTFIIDTEAPLIAEYHANGVAPASTFDADAPVVELPASTGTYDDGSGTVYYYSHAIDVDAKIQDRTFDDKGTEILVTKDGVETALENSWTREPEEVGPNGYELYKMTVPYAEDGAYCAPHVLSSDKAGNTSNNKADAEAMRFVVDLKAPTITVAVDHDPSAQGASGSSDPYNFYNQATKMTFTVSDEHLLRSAQLDDPSGQYSISTSEASAEGKGQVVLTASLKDGTPAQDAEYQRDIVLTAVDLAGNIRTWTIDHEGTVVLDKVSSSSENAAINGGSEHPQALIQDTVAPVVTLSGVTAGTYYNTAQTVEATVEELNFDYLQAFDGGRGIVTVTSYEGNAGRARSTSTVTANDFSGSKPNYSYSQSFSSDGHYELTAQFEDYAGNLSNQASIGEFTIDMTNPTIDVTWDNEDVRNDKYYKATRTATITVTEHNFDPSLFNVDTTGSMSGWSDNGDTHTCTVFFDEGSAHTLAISGADLAGNDAGVFSEPEFVVDLTEPEVEIAGTAQRLGYLADDANGGLVNAYHGDLEDKSAYNGVVVPVITYTDNEPLSSADLTYTVSGTKHGEEVELDAATSDEDKEMTTTFRDVGYVGPDSGDGSNWEDFYVDDYAVDADDIYTIKATITDQAGNEAEAEITFSVNRYGSNYVVDLQDLDADEKAEYEVSGMLWEAPTIVVREVNVSGVASQADHHVQKEFANITTAIAQGGGNGAGYSLESIEGASQENGWSEYVYTIRSANFGEGSDSDNNDRGQGQYRVNVMSDDRSSNANSTAAYWGSDDARTKATAAGATTQFVLDEVAPVIDDLNLPEHISAGESYEASFHVTDDITSGDVVRVYLDGKELDAAAVSGPKSGVGTFTFSIPAKAFNWGRSVRIVVTDYAGRTDEATNGTWIWQSSFIPEAAAGVGVIAAAVAGVVVMRRRKAAAEPELPV